MVLGIAEEGQGAHVLHLEGALEDLAPEIPLEDQGPLSTLNIAKHTLAKAIEDSSLRHAKILWWLARLPINVARRMLKGAIPRSELFGIDRQTTVVAELGPGSG